MLGDFFEGALDLIGGIGDAIGGLFGGNDDVFRLGMDIFGDDDDWGIFDSPITGNVLASVGAELLKPTAKEREKEARMQIRAVEDERRRSRRKNYGLPAEDPKPGTGLAPGWDFERHKRHGV